MTPRKRKAPRHEMMIRASPWGPIRLLADSLDEPARPASELDALRQELVIKDVVLNLTQGLVPKSVRHATFAEIHRRGRSRARGAADAREAKSAKARERTDALEEEIKRLRRVYGWSDRKIARHLKVSRYRVAKALRPAPK